MLIELVTTKVVKEKCNLFLRFSPLLKRVRVVGILFEKAIPAYSREMILYNRPEPLTYLLFSLDPFSSVSLISRVFILRYS